MTTKIGGHLSFWEMANSTQTFRERQGRIARIMDYSSGSKIWLSEWSNKWRKDTPTLCRGLCLQPQACELQQGGLQECAQEKSQHCQAHSNGTPWPCTTSIQQWRIHIGGLHKNEKRLWYDRCPSTKHHFSWGRFRNEASAIFRLSPDQRTDGSHCPLRKYESSVLCIRGIDWRHTIPVGM